MTLDSTAVRAEVDQYFSKLNDREQRLTNPETLTAEPWHDPISLLKLQNDKLPEENYEQFSRELAADPRMQKYLPMIAFDMFDREPGFNWLVGGRRDYKLSKDELLSAANNEMRFDAVHREALKFVANNFDKFRDFDKEDSSFLGLTSNSSKLTYRDLKKAGKDFGDFYTATPLIAANQLISKNFGDIDTSGNGQVTYKEAQSWLKTLPKPNCPLTIWLEGPSSTLPETCAFSGFLQSELPRQTNRQLAGSELITRESIAGRIDDLQKMRAKFAKEWDFDQAK